MYKWNGKHISKIDDDIANRLFCYGDGLFETIRIFEKHPFNPILHFERLSKSAKCLSLDFDLPFEAFKTIISKVLNDKSLTNARVRLHLFRQNGGFYTPSTNKSNLFIDAFALEKPTFPINQKGVLLGVFSDVKKGINSLSNLKTTNALIYVLSGIYAKKNNWNESLILNTENNLIESTSSNLFIVKNNEIFTPPLKDGCIDGTMRLTIIELIKILNIKIVEKSLTQTDLLSADEVFLTNAIKGVQRVLGFENKRYRYRISKQLQKQLNDNINLQIEE